jgi:hypothetical protein
MKRVSETFALPCTPETFWSIFFDPTYTRALYLDQLQFKGFTVVEQGESTRKLHIVPRVNLPGPLAKIVGDSFAYEEHGTLDRAQNVWRWRMVRPANTGGKKKDMVSTSGTIRLVADGPGRCRRTDEVDIEAHLFGFGGLIESVVEKELHSSWSKELAFLERWIAEHPTP